MTDKHLKTLRFKIDPFCERRGRGQAGATMTYLDELVSLLELLTSGEQTKLGVLLIDLAKEPTAKGRQSLMRAIRKLLKPWCEGRTS